MQEELETVRDHCKHSDCMYRSSIDAGQIPICYYAVLANECRGCKISECDKYKSGKPIRPRMDREYVVFWEYEIYDEDADFVW